MSLPPTGPGLPRKLDSTEENDSDVGQSEAEGLGSSVSAIDNPVPILPASEDQVQGQPLRERSAAIAGQNISSDMQKHLDDFSLNGSANALLSLLNSSKGLEGQFQIIFQPNDGGAPVPFEQFQQHPHILQAYQDIKQQITQNHQSIAYGLTQSMAMQQQQMAVIAMQQQQNTNMGLMQAMMYPVVQPMPVPLDYLLGFKGASTLPQQQQYNPAMGWGGVPGAVAPQPGWAPYPPQMLTAQPSIMQQPGVFSAPQPAGFCAVPGTPPQPNMGLQVPFSPWGFYAQQNPISPNADYKPFQQQLGQFAQASPLSLVPPWAYGGNQQSPIIINNVIPANNSQGKSDPVGSSSQVPTSNIQVNPVINNRIEKQYDKTHKAAQEDISDNNDKALDVINRDIWDQLQKISKFIDTLDDQPINTSTFRILNDLIDRINKLQSIVQKYDKQAGVLNSLTAIQESDEKNKDKDKDKKLLDAIKKLANNIEDKLQQYKKDDEGSHADVASTRKIVESNKKEGSKRNSDINDKFRTLSESLGDLSRASKNNENEIELEEALRKVKEKSSNDGIEEWPNNRKNLREDLSDLSRVSKNDEHEAKLEESLRKLKEKNDSGDTDVWPENHNRLREDENDSPKLMPEATKNYRSDAQEAIQQLNKKLDHLNKSIDAKEAIIDTILSDIEDFEEDELKDQLKKATKDIKSNLKNVRDDANSYKEALEEAKKNPDDEDNIIKNVDGGLSKSQSDVDKYGKELSKISQEVSNAIKTIDPALDKSINDAINQANFIIEIITKSKNDSVFLKNRVNELFEDCYVFDDENKEKLKAHANDIDSLKNRIANQIKRIEKNIEDLNGAKKGIQNRDSLGENIGQFLSDIKNTLNKEEVEAKEDASYISSLKGTLDDIEKDISNRKEYIQDALSSIVEKIDIIDNRIKGGKEKVEELIKNTDELKGNPIVDNNDELANRLNDIVEKVHSEKKYLEESKELNDKFKNVVNSDIFKECDNLQDSEEAIVKFNDGLEKITNHVDERIKSLNESSEDLGRLHAEIKLKASKNFEDAINLVDTIASETETSIEKLDKKAISLENDCHESDEESKNNIASQIKSIEKLKENASVYRRKIEEIKNNTQNNKGEVDKLFNEIQGSTKDIKAVDEKLNDLEKDVNKYKQDIANNVEKSQRDKKHYTTNTDRDGVNTEPSVKKKATRIKQKIFKASDIAKEALEVEAFTNIKKVFEENKLPYDKEDKIEEALSLIKSDKKFAKAWFEKSIALRKISEDVKNKHPIYGLISQREVVSLLEEFNIPKQIPVAALLAATLQDISTDDSVILPFLNEYYFIENKKSSTNLTREDGYANKIINLLEIESAEHEKNGRFQFRGMTLNSQNESIPYHHKDLLENDIQKITGGATSSSGRDVTIHCSLLKPLGAHIKGYEYQSSGEVFASPSVLSDRGLSIKTNKDAHPIEILGIRGGVWKVSPSILLNNPDMVVPFYDPDNIKSDEAKQHQHCGFIPISNTERVLGTESEGILVTNGKTCFLFTLTDDKKWRCRPIGKDLTPESIYQQKYEGYASLVMAHAAQPQADHELIKEDCVQAYKSWLKIGDNYHKTEDDFKTDLLQKIDSIRYNASWLSSDKKDNSYKVCKTIINEMANFNNSKSTAYATMLTEANGFNRSMDINEKNPQYHPAIIALTSKLSGQNKDGSIKSEGLFISKTSDNKSYFNTAKTSYFFNIYDKAFIEQLREEMPNADDLIDCMEISSGKFSNEFLKGLQAYEAGLINPDHNQADIDNNLLMIDKFISQLSVQENYLKLASTELYEKIKNILVQLDVNVHDVDDAKRLWIQGKLPDNLRGEDRDNYMEWMGQLAQTNWAANRLHCHVNHLKGHKDEIQNFKEKSDTLEAKDFKKNAYALNIRFAEIYKNINEMKDFLNDKNIMTRTGGVFRSLFGFMENKNIQLRSHQIKIVPKLMKEQANTIENEKPSDGLFLMEGTGGGKSLCMEAMVDNVLNCLSQKEIEFQKKHPVLIIAPDINAAQLRHSIGLSEQKNDRVLQDMELVLRELRSSYHDKTFNNATSLREIYNVLLGIDRKIPAEELDTAIASQRSACLLSFSAFQALMHATEKELNTTSDLTAESRALIYSIRDLFADGIIFGDECVSGPIPYTKADEQNIVGNIQEHIGDSDQDIEESACKTATGIMTNCFLFTGLSATKGTAAVGALFAGAESYEKTVEALNENLTTTRHRAFDRLSQARVIRSTSDKNHMAAAIVSRLQSNHGVTILDTETQDSAKLTLPKFAMSWQTSLHNARQNQDDQNGAAPSFSTGYIADNGETMLFDPRRSEYSTQSNSRLGNPINPSDETSLRASGAHYHDNILAAHQGVGSDPIQGKNTAYVMTGIFGAVEHGRSDLVEQWAGRGTRASNEPYYRQDLFLTVTEEDIDKIRKKCKSSNNDQMKELKQCLTAFNQSKATVEEAENNLEGVIKDSKPSHELQVIVNQFKRQPLDIEDGRNKSEQEKINDAADVVTEKLKKQIDNFSDSQEVKKKILDAFKVYIKAEETFQIKAHLLLFTEMATRENNTFTAQHEEWAFEGDEEYFLEKMKGLQEHWARAQVSPFKNEHGADISKVVKQAFSKNLQHEQEKIKQDHSKLQNDLYKELCKANIYKEKKKGRPAFSVNWKDSNTEVNERFKKFKAQSSEGKEEFIERELKVFNENKRIFNNDIKLEINSIKEKIQEYEKLNKINKYYNSNLTHRNDVENKMIECFKKSLSTVSRVRKDKGVEDFQHKLGISFDKAINDSCNFFKTIDSGKDEELIKAFDSLKPQVEKFLEGFINRAEELIILHEDHKIEGGKELADVKLLAENIRNNLNADKAGAETYTQMMLLNEQVKEYLLKIAGSNKILGVGNSKGTNFSDMLKYFLETPKESMRRSVNGQTSWSYGENKVHYSRSVSGDTRSYPVSIEGEFLLDSLKKMYDEKTEFSKALAKRDTLIKEDAAVRETLRQCGQSIKRKILGKYQQDCLNPINAKIRQKNELRDKQAKMKLSVIDEE